jgi:hypothetical protein
MDNPGTGVAVPWADTGRSPATVVRVVGRPGGKVRAEGTVDRGATFHFALAPTA